MQCRVGYEAVPDDLSPGGDSLLTTGGTSVGGAAGAAAHTSSGGASGSSVVSGGTGAISGTGGSVGSAGSAGNAPSEPTCADGSWNGLETDVDCGGDPQCSRCAPLQRCIENSDCQSSICSSNLCQTPTCTDKVRNGDETGTDCGGSCAACPTGEACSVWSDCQSGVCGGVPTTCQVASCSDNLKNGNETDKDCGGATSCARCGTGLTCSSGTDCQSGSCSGNVCVAPASCSDSTKNGTETAVDCGGPSCPQCGAGATCSSATDCQSGVCNVTCQAPSCGDRVKNGTETGVDCGGNCPSCTTPIGVRVMGASKANMQGGMGGSPFDDMCPHDQVVIGFSGYTDTVDPTRTWIDRLQTVCGVLNLTAGGSYAITTSPGATLPMRGLLGNTVWTRTCPAGQVVTGFSGRSGLYIDQISFQCAPLIVSASGTYSVSIGGTTSLPSIGGNGGNPFPLTTCPAGQIARGSFGRHGDSLDALGLICSTPWLTFPVGASCSNAAQCESGVCNGSCGAATCNAAAGCSCVKYDLQSYQVCRNAIIQSSAQSQCQSAGMRLTRINDELENAWLRATANTQNISNFYLGATDLALAGSWDWADGTRFYSNGSPVAGLYNAWAAGNPAAGNKHCAQMISASGWENRACNQTAAYVCEKY